MKIQDIHGNTLFEDGSLTIKETLEAAVRAGANLQYANLQGAYLQGANLQGASYLQGANLQGANLQGANLQGARLQDAKLQYANLQDANLQGAYLQGAYLQGAYLQGANLQGANLQGANLQGARLQDAKLQYANLQGAYLQGANLQGANLQGADLQDAYLQGANLQYAYLQHANLQGAESFNFQCPEFQRTRILPEGSLIGWKKCQNGVLVKLRIPEEAKRSHAFGRKCRAEYADVLEVIGASEAFSMHDEGKTVYKAGTRVYPDGFSDDWQEECAPGIHFFITRAEAEYY